MTETLFTLDLRILALTVVAMVLVAWAYYKWRGRGYATILLSVVTMAGGFAGMYFQLPAILHGRVDCFGRSPGMRRLGWCEEPSFWLASDPGFFWLNAAVWLGFAAILIGGGVYVIHRVLHARRAARDTAPPPPYDRRAGVLWSLGAVLLAALSVSFLIEKKASDPLYAPAPEPLRLRLDPNAK